MTLRRIYSPLVMECNMLKKDAIRVITTCATSYRIGLLKKCGFEQQAIGWMLNEDDLKKDLDQLFSTVIYQRSIGV